MINPQSTEEPKVYTETEYATTVRYLVASFIGWQIAVVNQVSDDEDGHELGLNIAGDAEDNIRTLLLGGSVDVNGSKVTLENDVGRQLAEHLSASIIDTAKAMEEKYGV